MRQRSARLCREGLAQRSWATGTREIVATGYRSDRPASPGGLEPPGPWLAVRAWITGCAGNVSPAYRPGGRPSRWKLSPGASERATGYPKWRPAAPGAVRPPPVAPPPIVERGLGCLGRRVRNGLPGRVCPAVPGSVDEGVMPRFSGLADHKNPVQLRTKCNRLPRKGKGSSRREKRQSKSTTREHYCEVLSNELDRNGARGEVEWRNAKSRNESERQSEEEREGEKSRALQRWNRCGEGEARSGGFATGEGRRCARNGTIRTRRNTSSRDAPLRVVVRIHRGT